MTMPAATARAATFSAWSVWSWVDVARFAGWGVVGGAVAAILAAFTAFAPATTASTRALALYANLLAWTLPVALACCLAGGARRQSARDWYALLARVALILLPYLAVAALLLLIPWPHLTPRGDAWCPPLLAWPLVGLGVGLALTASSPRQYPAVTTLPAGLVAGLLAAVLAQPLTAPLAAWPGVIARLAGQACAAVPAGFLIGLSMAVLREMGKTAWLQVIFGDDPGRHYLIDHRPFTLGSAPDSDLRLPPAMPHHLTLHRGNHGAMLTVGAHNAGLDAMPPLVLLNNRRLEVSELYDGDFLQIGDIVFRYYEVP